MKRTLLAVAIAASTAAVGANTSSSMFSSFSEYMYSFTQYRQFNMMQIGPGGGLISVNYQSHKEEYRYMRQEVMMANLANYVTYAAPGFGTDPNVGSGGNPAASGCDSSNPFANTSCDPEIATDPATDTTVATYPNGNALYMQGNQVHYEYQHTKITYASIDYTMTNLCGCMPSTAGQDFSGTFVGLRQMGYSYESVYEMYHVASFQMGFMQMPMMRSADQGLSLAPADEATDAMLEQAKQAVNS
ncbi:MAG: hypothetical protein GY862_36235 [Gammaproteobacteria bacterium]|nr:hypothetical protein [Gammaproteobacteria bacterium]